MIQKDISFLTPEENLLFDDVLLYLAEQGQSGEVVRFWECQQYFIVLGKISDAQKDIEWEAVRREGIPVLRRSSGGGTVLQGRGCLNYSFILSKENRPEILTIHQSYRFILEKLVQTLRDLKVEVVFKPISDLATADGDKKFSGNAQRRSKKYILHHGTILYDFDLPKIAEFLKMPENIPAYRGGRGHLDFVTNINISLDQFKKMCGQKFGVKRHENKLTNSEKDCLEQWRKVKNIFVSPKGKNFGLSD